jgi:hypothetical protein
MKTVCRRALGPAIWVVLAGCRLLTGTATLVVENSSSFTVDEVRIAPPEAVAWSDDLLTATIPPGESHAFPCLTPGTYDILVRDTGEGWDVWLGEVLEPRERHPIAYPR